MFNISQHLTDLADDSNMTPGVWSGFDMSMVQSDLRCCSESTHLQEVKPTCHVFVWAGKLHLIGLSHISGCFLSFSSHIPAYSVYINVHRFQLRNARPHKDVYSCLNKCFLWGNVYGMCKESPVSALCIIFLPKKFSLIRVNTSWFVANDRLQISFWCYINIIIY